MIQHAAYFGVFRPRRTEDLRQGAAAAIDREMLWTCAWRIEDGEYAGEWAMVPHSLCAFGWAPSGDVTLTRYIGEIPKHE